MGWRRIKGLSPAVIKSYKEAGGEVRSQPNRPLPPSSVALVGFSTKVIPVGSSSAMGTVAPVPPTVSPSSSTTRRSRGYRRLLLFRRGGSPTARLYRHFLPLLHGLDLLQAQQQRVPRALTAQLLRCPTVRDCIHRFLQLAHEAVLARQRRGADRAVLGQQLRRLAPRRVVLERGLRKVHVIAVLKGTALLRQPAAFGADRHRPSYW